MNRDRRNNSNEDEGIAIIGMGCVLPDALNVPSFWKNIQSGTYSIREIPEDEWLISDYYDPDRRVPDKTYCKLGAFVRGFEFNSIQFKIPPKMGEKIDPVQQWALAATQEALADAGYFDRPVNRDKTAVIIGNAMGGQIRLKTAQRLFFPQVRRVLENTSLLKSLPAEDGQRFMTELESAYTNQFPDITEDTMPGELSNIISGRVANVFNLRGANYTTDAACGSSLAALQAAVYGLRSGDFDAVVTGGSDRSMSPDTYVKFSKIGALSGERSCPFDESASGFIMGEGAVMFVLKRLTDAERDGDRIYAVIRSIGSSSDGKGKGITAPNVKGQLAALERAYEISGISPDTISLIEAHGTSTIMGDQAEIAALKELFKSYNLPRASIPVGSVKSQIGHLKSAAGAAGLLKTVLSLHHKILPATINCEKVSAALEIEKSPFYVIRDMKAWDGDYPRRAGISSFGFGGTNFHVIVEEYNASKRASLQSARTVDVRNTAREISLPGTMLVIGSFDQSGLVNKLESVVSEGKMTTGLPTRETLESPFRVAIHAENGSRIQSKAKKLLQAIRSRQQPLFEMLRNQGVFTGSGKSGKIAFLFPGQGSQYVNMGRRLSELYPQVSNVFRAADRIMEPRLGRKLTDYIFVDQSDPAVLKEANEQLRHTSITQPAVLALDIGLYQLLNSFGIAPEMVIGHSLGEYAALVAAGILSFEDALIAASARAREMSDLTLADNGLMASVFADYSHIRDILAECEGYVIAANINSPSQTVIAGESDSVREALARCAEQDIKTVLLPVSHAFHTKIVAPAAPRLRKILETMEINSPRIPIISNVTGAFYPSNGDVRTEVLDLLEQQVQSTVQYRKGIETLWDAGARVFVEVGAKKALSGMISDILGKKDHVALFSNHPKKSDDLCFGEMLAGLYAAGIGPLREAEQINIKQSSTISEHRSHDIAHHSDGEVHHTMTTHDENTRYLELGKAVGKFIQMMPAFMPQQQHQQFQPQVSERKRDPLVISGISLGLPGRNRKLFHEDNFADILAGRNFIEKLSEEDRQHMCEKGITRLVKRSAGDPTLELISSPDEMVHLAALVGPLDLKNEFAISPELTESMNHATQMAIAAGIIALRDSGIPLKLHYRQTTTGKQLPTHWALPTEIGDETGVIYAAAFAGTAGIMPELKEHYMSLGTEKMKRLLHHLEQMVPEQWKGSPIETFIQKEIETLKESRPYTFNRKFIFHSLPMGASQLAQHIGARGPNTHVNSACASTSVALGVAHDWIRTGRCKRVVVLGADDATAEVARDWIVSGLFALGAATAEKEIENAALPFDRRRNGMISGSGAVGLVLEEAAEVRKRGMRGLSEFLGIDYMNSGFHPSRLDVPHIKSATQRFMAKMEKEYHFDRYSLSAKTMFMSHETYTPARGGSAAAEIESLRAIYGEKADDVIIANTKGFTGHAMGAGIEEVVTVKALQLQQVPPVANFREADPGLGNLNLSKGGEYPVSYALKFAAGFGSQFAISLYRRIEGSEERIENRGTYQDWLNTIAGKENATVETVHNTLRIKNGDHASVPQSVTAEIGEPSKLSAATIEEGTQKTEQQQTITKVPAVQTEILTIVAEKTGYPLDMLELDLDLEADLGIDTVKQAEIFSLIREKYNLPRSENLKLRDYPTLQHLIGYVTDQGGTSPDSEMMEISAQAPSVHGETAENTIEKQIITLVANKTGYPEDMLELDLDLEADLGVDTVKQAEVFAEIRELFVLPKRDDLKLRDYPTLQHLIKFVTDSVGPGVALSGTSTPKEDVPPSSPVKGNTIAEKIVAIVAEKTGYPADMLELDLDLEADLGVDTVKQAEVFARIRELFQIPRRDDLKLRDYPTLQHLIDYVGEMSESFTGPNESSPIEQATPPPSDNDSADDVATKIMEIIAERTGYPEDMLELDLDLEADLGVDTVKQAEVFARIRELFHIPQRDDLKLRDYPTLQHLIDFVHQTAGEQLPRVSQDEETADVETSAIPAELEKENTPQTRTIFRYTPELFPAPLPEERTAESGCFEGNPLVLVVADGDRNVWLPLAKRLREFEVKVVILTDMVSLPAEDGMIIERVDLTDEEQIHARISELHEKFGDLRGVFHLIGLEEEPPPDAVGDIAWTHEIKRRVSSLFSIVQGALDDFQRHDRSGQPFIVSASALGGSFGFPEMTENLPMGGLVAGLTKSLGKELPDVRVKICDFDYTDTEEYIADSLIDELLFGNEKREIGFFDKKRHEVQVVPQDLPLTTDEYLTINADTVIVMSGGVLGITAEMAKELARLYQPSLLILDIVDFPEDIETLCQKNDDELTIVKKDLLEQLKQQHERVTPVMLDQHFGRILKSITAWKNLKTMKEHGSSVIYRCCDVTVEENVQSALQEARNTFGSIDVVVHGAGLEESRSLAHKKRRTFDKIIEVKVLGALHLIRHTLKDGLKKAVFFASVAGRFGNIGQTDYAAANDFLNKYAAWINGSEYDSRAVAINWTGWAEIGMATKETIKNIFDAAGINMIPLKEGIEIFRRELISCQCNSEVVIAGNLGFLDDHHQIVTAQESMAWREIRERLQTSFNRCALIDGIENYMPGISATFTKKVTLEKELFLKDHAIDNIPLFPGVMGLEAFSEAAGLLYPGHEIVAIENVRFQQALKIFQQRPAEVKISLMNLPLQTDGKIRLAAQLLSDFIDAKGRKLGDRRLHFESIIVLGVRETAPSFVRETDESGKGQLIDRQSIYSVLFHGPLFQVCDEVTITDKIGAEGLMHRIDSPLIEGQTPQWSIGPMQIELGFQTAGLYEYHINKRFGLPSSITRIEFYQGESSEELPVFAIIKPVTDGEESGAFDITIATRDRRFIDISGYRTIIPVGSEG